jgi:hypothetical protein
MGEMKNAYFRRINRKGGDTLGDLGVDGRIILNRSQRHGFEDVDWIHLAQDRVPWPAPLNTVWNLPVKAGNLLIS